MEKKEIIFKYIILTTVYVSFLLLFWPFKTALLLASLFAMAMTPLLERLLKKTKREKLVIFLMVFGLLFVVIGPLTAIISRGIFHLSQLQQDTITQLPIYKNIETTIHTLWDFVNKLTTRFNVDISEDFDVKGMLPKLMQSTLPVLTALLTKFPQFLLQLFVFITSLYFFLLRRREFFDWFKERELLPVDSLTRLVNLLQKTSNTVVISTLIVAMVQATIINIAASIAGYDNLMIIFVLTFFMAFVPVVGSVPVSLSLAVFSFLQGEAGNGVIMLIALGFAGGIDNVIRAYILSAEEEAIHPLISLLTLIGALAMFGVPGLFLGPIIAELAFAIGKIMNGNQTAAVLPPNAAEASEPEPQRSR
jgi:predicted PurR-regulated permease PerM